ncbi:hypothetical protein AM1_B0199 (plasmid) [Acaryochloris marina MBIC11017]|uniref:Uncharacterized protein n=1 Tax=Acaryochloris marina (strain MBIC 11017) TaxID=329726 RepID=A8ZL92_ACAM1|nr:hypothetical protein AM1_B0199 [Acaryochloris marina MBIC11017]
MGFWLDLFEDFPSAVTGNDIRYFNGIQGVDFLSGYEYYYR